jgi:hypothetical protein
MAMRTVPRSLPPECLLGESEVDCSFCDLISAAACSASNFFLRRSLTSGLTFRSLFERRSTGTRG